MRRSTILFVALAALVAAVCIRLGFWQLGRLAERRARNVTVATRLDSAVVGPEAVPADTGLLRYRRVRLTGRYDFENQLILSGRTRQGSPGVHFLTPIRIPGRDTAIVVNRGWVYAPDALTADPIRWREPADATVTGFALPFPGALRGPAEVQGYVRTVRHPDLASIRAQMPYPVADYYVVTTDTVGFDPDSTPARLAPPALDEGSHLSYAFQWFSFAAIALGGAGVVAWQTRGTRV